MSVLKGEGTHSMLFGSYRLPVGRDLHAYIARPDHSGSFPTVIVAHGAWGLSSHVKAVCRRLARHGFAAIAPDLYRGSLRGRLTDASEAADAFAALPDGRPGRDLAEAADNAMAPGTDWADGRRIAVLAMGEGGEGAFAAAATIDSLAALVLLYAPADAAQLGAVEVPVLGVYGADDDATADVRAAHAALDRGEFAFYAGVGRDFADESREGYDHGSAEDAFERILGFLGSQLVG